jgi:hypothetical protein
MKKVLGLRDSARKNKEAFQAELEKVLLDNAEIIAELKGAFSRLDDLNTEMEALFYQLIPAIFCEDGSRYLHGRGDVASFMNSHVDSRVDESYRVLFPPYKAALDRVPVTHVGDAKGDVKRCCSCGEMKPTASFGNDKSRRDGLKIDCKLCISVNRKQIRGIAAEVRSAYAACPDKDSVDWDAMLTEIGPVLIKGKVGDYDRYRKECGYYRDAIRKLTIKKRKTHEKAVTKRVKSGSRKTG